MFLPMYLTMHLTIKKIIRNKLIHSSLYQRLLRPLVSSRLSSQYRKNLRQIDKFCLFVGWARTGSTLLSTLLNAHPQIAIAHEQLGDLSEVSQNLCWRKQERMTWLVNLSLSRERFLAYLAKSAESQRSSKHTGYEYYMRPPPPPQIPACTFTNKGGW